MSRPVLSAFVFYDEQVTMTNSNASRLQRCETQLQDFLAVALKNVPIRELNAKAVPGKWSAHEQLAHLARYHQIFLQRIDRILTEQAPRFPRYRAEEDPEWPAWSGLPAQQVLVRISSMRGKLMARLRSLSQDDFERTGVHPKFGSMSLSLWLEFFLVHEAHHLYVVLQLVRENG
ncbi:MAG TPA: DinB family protein [Candidatus Angelobacter sp.]|nr:DinB family protein [Candidatus Angelobacter sp.]